MILKKTLLTSYFVLLLLGPVFCQSSGILLQWKIAKGDTLNYQTVMNSRRLVTEDTAKTDSLAGIFKNLFNSLSKVNASMKYQTNLFLNAKNNTLIDIEMKTVVDPTSQKGSSKNKPNNFVKDGKDKNKNKQTDTDKEVDSLTFANMFASLTGRESMVVLRGRITPNGEVVSTYYKSSQKNLISSLFALPNKPVQIGEKWQLNANFIEMDQNFYADSSSSVNEVYIEKVIEENNDKIAIVKYNIQEFVMGSFSSALMTLPGMGGEERIFMKYNHIATGYFSIGKGKWINYEGTSELESNFRMIGGKTITSYKLIE